MKTMNLMNYSRTMFATASVAVIAALLAAGCTTENKIKRIDAQGELGPGQVAVRQNDVISSKDAAEKMSDAMDKLHEVIVKTVAENVAKAATVATVATDVANSTIKAVSSGNATTPSPESKAAISNLLGAWDVANEAWHGVLTAQAPLEKAAGVTNVIAASANGNTPVQRAAKLVPMLNLLSWPAFIAPFVIAAAGMTLIVNAVLRGSAWQPWAGLLLASVVSFWALMAVPEPFNYGATLMALVFMVPPCFSYVLDKVYRQKKDFSKEQDMIRTAYQDLNTARNSPITSNAS